MKKLYCVRWLLIITMLISSMTVIGCSGSDDKYVSFVKQGSMLMEPNVPVGKAFDQFFSNGKWKSFKSKGERIVEFNGECTWYGSPAKIKVQFAVEMDDQTFNVHHVGINGNGLSDLESIGVVAKVLEDYTPRK